MKNIYLFFIFLFIISCSQNSTISSNNRVSCPSILFSLEHKAYIGTTVDDISLDNVEYQGIINNAVFSNKCIVENNIFFAEISILFILQPLVDTIDNINIPFYLAILDKNKELQDILYFTFTGEFKKDLESQNLLETEFIKNIRFEHQSITENSIIVVGYILDKKQMQILN